MNRRVLISFVAVISMLMHAGLLARHNTLMMAQAAQPQDILFSQGFICHGGGEQQPAQPLLPDTDQKQTANCPLCLGLGPIFAVLSSGAGDAVSPPVIKIDRWIVPAQMAIPARTVGLPPSRGPPLNI